MDTETLKQMAGELTRIIREEVIDWPKLLEEEAEAETYERGLYA